MPIHIGKLVVILGPTSSGKSALAIDAAKRWNGEIISADSRQVYRGMDIGSGKVSKQEQLSVPHHLLDISDPNDAYNISHFLRDARSAIADISARGKLPIVCGGTGFWIQTLVENQALPNVPPNPELRESLAEKTPEELFRQLMTLDPVRAEKTDPKNPRRLIRAIEIATATQRGDVKTPSETPLFPGHRLIIALCPPKAVLDERIRTRLDERFEQGMIDEVVRLNQDGVPWERLDAFGLEYRWISRFLRGMLPMGEMRERLFFDSIHYAKRQMTWIRRWQKLDTPVFLTENSRKAMEKIREFLKEKPSA